ncbi:helix-turn-helix domain-containing protein [Streptomyces lycii]|uniref:PucR family transcriptional regulator n=1 Tax=Streptomyces lycii TaxID=2654337 RepID=A0ABQ7FR83_9ACTN|nr:helix-turn-helix domain-containing protein [Streptomyces lycii]KAF4409912.1 PucR family transcriptional regulator [Streptomyces lycii]
MLTMYDLAAGQRPVLRYLDPVPATRPDTARTIEQVAVCDERWRLPADVQRARDVLAIVPFPAAGGLPDPGAALRALAGRGVVAVALAPPDGSPPPETATAAAAAHATGLPLLAPVGPSDAGDLQARVLRRQIAALRDGVEQRDRLLRLSARLDRQGKGAAPLLRQLEAECAADVRLIEPADPGWREDTELGRVLTQVRRGQVHTAAFSTAGRHVVLHAVGTTAPHQVLAAIRPTPWPRPLRDLIAHAAGQISLLRHPVVRRTAERRLEQSGMAVQLSILQYLMVGGVAAAVRAAEPLVPGVLTTDAGQVAVIECAPAEDRAGVARECEAAVGRGLVALCPAQERHVIIAIPQPADDGPDATDLLAPVMRAGRAAGVSTPEPWTRTARAYESAARALITARQTPGRITVHAGGTPLASLLPPSAHRWARTLLRPLDALPAAHRDQLVHTARLALAYGAAAAGSLLGVDRTTAGKRLTTVMRYAGLSRRSLPHRAVLDLAFQLEERPGDPENSSGIPPRLHSLLREHEEARAEAERFLAPLDLRARALLRTWITCNGAVQRTAAELGIHRNSVPHRLERAGTLLERSLSPHGSGPHDVLWALVLTGGLPVDIVPDPVAGATR